MLVRVVFKFFCFSRNNNHLPMWPTALNYIVFESNSKCRHDKSFYNIKIIFGLVLQRACKKFILRFRHYFSRRMRKHAFEVRLYSKAIRRTGVISPIIYRVVVQISIGTNFLCIVPTRNGDDVYVLIIILRLSLV